MTIAGIILATIGNRSVLAVSCLASMATESPPTSRRRRRRLGRIAATTVVVLVGSLAVAQSVRQTLRPTLHEDLPAPTREPTSPTIGSAGSGNPTGLITGNKILPEPQDPPAKKTATEPVLGNGGFAADRATAMRPDTNTGSDGTLHYVSVFNPDVLPFKRMTSLDGVRDDYTLEIARPALTEVPVGGASNNTRDRFWGSVLLKLSPGTDVPLPSVAPDMRILSYEIRPTTRIKFERDGADNFYVRSDESSANGTYRLTFLADADAGYFAPSVPVGVRLTPRQVAELAPPALRPKLPDPVRRAAQRTLERLIRIDDTMELEAAFNLLVRYFRGFEAKELPVSSGDIYRDLCESQAGVCRHRAFAFMVTSNTLGIPTRYVHNEAHAFVEVWFPQRNWQRIDLGGAALRMEVTGADDKTLHRPRKPDPFDKPRQYTNSYTQLEGDIRGLTDQQLADKRQPLDSAPPSGAYGSELGSGNEVSNDRITPDPTLPEIALDPKKLSPRLEISIADSSAYRGDVVHIEGRASVGGKPIRDHRIEVFLAPAGRAGRYARPLGNAVTDHNGTFSQDFDVPGDLDLATYELYLASREDETYNAALSN